MNTPEDEQEWEKLKREAELLYISHDDIIEMEYESTILLDRMNEETARLLEEIKSSNLSINDDEIAALLDSKELNELLSSMEEDIELDNEPAIDDTPAIEFIPNATIIDVARWMHKILEEKNILYQRQTAHTIRKMFGEQFVYLNKNRNYGINRNVLKAFLVINAASVVWADHPMYYWRFRREGDPPGRRVKA